MTFCGGIRDKPGVMQSNYTVIVMGLKLDSPLLCQNSDPSSMCVLNVCVYEGGGLLISKSDPGPDWTFNHPSLHIHKHTHLLEGKQIEKQLVYLGESLLLKGGNCIYIMCLGVCLRVVTFCFAAVLEELGKKEH